MVSATVEILNIPEFPLTVNEPVFAVKSDTVALPPVVDQYNNVPFATLVVSIILIVYVPPSLIFARLVLNQ